MHGEHFLKMHRRLFNRYDTLYKKMYVHYSKCSYTFLKYYDGSGKFLSLQPPIINKLITQWSHLGPKGEVICSRRPYITPWELHLNKISKYWTGFNFIRLIASRFIPCLLEFFRWVHQKVSWYAWQHRLHAFKVD